MSGKVVKLMTTKKALELTGYRSINSLKQLHESEDVALTCFKVKGGSGQGGVGPEAAPEYAGSLFPVLDH